MFNRVYSELERIYEEHNIDYPKHTICFHLLAKHGILDSDIVAQLITMYMALEATIDDLEETNKTEKTLEKIEIYLNEIETILKNI